CTAQDASRAWVRAGSGVRNPVLRALGSARSPGRTVGRDPNIQNYIRLVRPGPCARPALGGRGFEPPVGSAGDRDAKIQTQIRCPWSAPDLVRAPRLEDGVSNPRFLFEPPLARTPPRDRPPAPRDPGGYPLVGPADIPGAAPP